MSKFSASAQIVAHITHDDGSHFTEEELMDLHLNIRRAVNGMGLTIQAVTSGLTPEGEAEFLAWLEGQGGHAAPNIIES